jgi:hypothetical protein
MPVKLHEGSNPQHTPWKVVRFRWVADDKGTAQLDFFCYGEVRLITARAEPEAAPPADGYNIFLEDEDIIDFLGKQGKGLKGEEIHFIEPLMGQTMHPVAVGRHMFRITGAGPGGSGRVAIFVRP